MPQMINLNIYINFYNTMINFYNYYNINYNFFFMYFFISPSNLLYSKIHHHLKQTNKMIFWKCMW